MGGCWGGEGAGEGGSDVVEIGQIEIYICSCERKNKEMWDGNFAIIDIGGVGGGENDEVLV